MCDSVPLVQLFSDIKSCYSKEMLYVYCDILIVMYDWSLMAIFFSEITKLHTRVNVTWIKQQKELRCVISESQWSKRKFHQQRVTQHSLITSLLMRFENPKSCIAQGQCTCWCLLDWWQRAICQLLKVQIWNSVGFSVRLWWSNPIQIHRSMSSNKDTHKAAVA